MVLSSNHGPGAGIRTSDAAMDVARRLTSVTDGLLRRSHSLGSLAPERAFGRVQVRLNVPSDAAAPPSGVQELHGLDAQSLRRVVAVQLVLDELLDVGLVRAALLRCVALIGLVRRGAIAYGQISRGQLPDGAARHRGAARRRWMQRRCAAAPPAPPRYAAPAPPPRVWLQARQHLLSATLGGAPRRRLRRQRHPNFRPPTTRHALSPFSPSLQITLQTSKTPTCHPQGHRTLPSRRRLAQVPPQRQPRNQMGRRPRRPRRGLCHRHRARRAAGRARRRGAAGPPAAAAAEAPLPVCCPGVCGRACGILVSVDAVSGGRCHRAAASAVYVCRLALLPHVGPTPLPTQLSDHPPPHTHTLRTPGDPFS